MKKIKEKFNENKDKTKKWFEKKENKSFVIILTTLVLTISLFYYFGWWDLVGILFIKLGLGLKTGAAKTFAEAVAKVGGKKVIASATAGVLVKRHFIDVLTKFLMEHSISRIKDSLKEFTKLKVKEFKETSFVKKLQAFGALLLTIPGVYYLWTKLLSVAIQKFVYGFFFTLVTFLWNFITGFFNVLGFILEILALNALFKALENYKWGRKILKGLDAIVYFIVEIASYINLFIKWVLSFFGIKWNFKSYVIKKSIQLNNYLVSILEKGLTRMTKIQNKRDRYVNIVERISEKRYLYLQKKKDKKVAFFKAFKESFKKKVLKKKTWREKREERLKKQKQKRDKYVSKRREKALKKETSQKVSDKLTLSYHNLVRWGDVPFRAK